MLLNVSHCCFAFHRTGYAEFNMGNTYQFWNQKRYSNVSLYDRPIIGMTIAVDNASQIKDHCLPEKTAVLIIIVNNVDEHKQIFDLQVLATTPDPKLFVHITIDMNPENISIVGTKALQTLKAFVSCPGNDGILLGSDSTAVYIDHMHKLNDIRKKNPSFIINLENDKEKMRKSRQRVG